MLPEEFHEELRKNGIVLTEEQMEKFAVYFERLVEWNQKMNLTAITEKSEVYLEAFLRFCFLSFKTALTRKVIC